MSITITDPEEIHLYRLSCLRGALKLEILGMRHSSGKSVYSRIKDEFGFSGNRKRVLMQLEEHIKERREACQK